VYFNVNFNVFFKLIKVHLLVSEFYMFNTCLEVTGTGICLIQGGSKFQVSYVSTDIFGELLTLALENLQHSREI
jgi:hypothetical protein